MDTIVNQIVHAIDATGRVVAALHADQLDLPSLCAEWDVRTELNHLVGGMRIFAGQLAGTGTGAAHESDWLRVDPWSAYASAAAADRHAWRAPGALDGTVTISLGTLPGPMAAVVHLTEVLAHG